MSKLTLRRKEEVWWLINDNDKPSTETILGERRSSLHRRGIEAIRDGTDVLIASDTGKDVIVPSATITQGFSAQKNGKPLWLLMAVGCIYDGNLRQIY